jgi:CHAT domain-containing protein
MMASNQRVYEAFVRVLMAEHDANPSAGFERQALEISERARARSLLEMVMDMRPDAPGGPSSAMDELRRLQGRIHSKAQAADAAQRAKRANAPSLARELSELTDQFGLAEARLKRETPDAATVASPEPLTVDAIQRDVLDPDTVLVEYMLGEPASYAWIVSQGSLSAHRLASRAAIEAAAEKCRAAVALPPSTGGTPQPQGAGATASAALSRLLIAPLGALPAGKRLLIVAPGSLQQVPFAGLSDGSGALVARHEIVHAPSASIVAAVRRLDDQRVEAPRALAVFADPVFDASDPRVTAHSATASAGDARDQDPTPLARAVRGVAPDTTTLPRLPFTRREADAIAAFAPPSSTLKATDFSASLHQVTKPSLADYRILHFATHGLLDTRTPELSGLVFSLVTEQGHPQDGFLRLTDISGLRLNADLAVLSGCDTGRGQSVDGEGVIGLTRSFVLAGARRVVASLWEVDDLATAEFMKRFYREMLERHRPPSAALAIAQRQLAASERWSAPYFWAGFVIQGEWRQAAATTGR